MNIVFNVNKQDYQLKGGTGDFTLNRYYGTKKVKVKGKDDLQDVEDVKLVGFFGNVFQALEHIIQDQTLNNDATTLLELRDIYFNTIDEIRTIAKQFKLEG